eukprot:TRINITY_DN65739_c6_g8_i1.p1 TRINITY_DN65739_c6_g8~~TRINITY_DN65739_c6_g8_i1.p1  ORF type:complete len:341 (-),score=169.00 TRINITY_DN65739_c6_g8_i1:75-1097(-)
MKASLLAASVVDYVASRVAVADKQRHKTIRASSLAVSHGAMVDMAPRKWWGGRGKAQCGRCLDRLSIAAASSTADDDGGDDEASLSASSSAPSSSSSSSQSSSSQPPSSQSSTTDNNDKTQKKKKRPTNKILTGEDDLTTEYEYKLGGSQPSGSKTVYDVLDEDMESCIEWKHKSLQRLSAKFMLHAMDRAGCPISADFIRCRPCRGNMGGALGFSEDEGAHIVLCCNKVKHEEHVHNTIVHELIHAFDWCRAEVDFRNLFHLACTEIRAANLSGDCHWSREVERGHFAIGAHHNVCVRRRAELSVRASPLCESDEMAAEAVDKVWDVCINDLTPFGAVP